MYRPASTNIFFPQGNIAIGSHTAPTERLSVTGVINAIGDSGSHYKVNGKEIVGSYQNAYFLCDSAPADGYNTHILGNQIYLKGGTDKVLAMSILSSGNVDIHNALNLISTTSNGYPSAQLLFAGGVGRIYVNASGKMYQYADSFTFRPASTTAASSIGVTIDAEANISTQGMLKLPAVDSGFTNPRITFGDSVIRIGATTAGLLGVYASGDIRLNPNSASSANGTMGLWLKASGYNGINISSPTQALHVNGKGIFADATNPWVSLQRDGVNWYLQVTSGGLRLGRTSANAMGVDESGNIQIPGAITMFYSSDERLKKNIRRFNASEVLMSLGGVYQYEYIASEVEKNNIYAGTHFGLIYQNIKGSALNKMCYEREDKMGALNYLDTDFISLIAGATMENISEVEKLKKENKALRKRVEQLEKRVA